MSYEQRKGVFEDKYIDFPCRLSFLSVLELRPQIKRLHCSNAILNEKKNMNKMWNKKVNQRLVDLSVWMRLFIKISVAELFSQHICNKLWISNTIFKCTECTKEQQRGIHFIHTYMVTIHTNVGAM